MFVPTLWKKRQDIILSSEKGCKATLERKNLTFPNLAHCCPCVLCSIGGHDCPSSPHLHDGWHDPQSLGPLQLGDTTHCVWIFLGMGGMAHYLWVLCLSHQL